MVTLIHRTSDEEKLVTVESLFHTFTAVCREIRANSAYDGWAIWEALA